MKKYCEFKPMGWKYFISIHMNNLWEHHINHIGSEIGYEEYPNSRAKMLDITYYLR